MSLRPLRAAVQTWRPGAALPVDPAAALAAAWPAIVGEQVAAHSRPLTISGDALAIATRSSAWSQQLQFLSLAILAGVNALPQGAGIVRLTFRSGAMRSGTGTSRTALPPAREPLERASGPQPGPAADLWEAFERLRRRVGRLRAAAVACRSCGAPLAPGTGVADCFPCRSKGETERFVAAQRTLYMTPWLAYTETREQVPGLLPGEFERARRHLLQRWWLMLERARRAKRVSASGFERQIASAYVLLQARLPPDRIGPAIVRNVLGAELEALVWGTEADSSNTTSR